MTFLKLLSTAIIGLKNVIYTVVAPLKDAATIQELIFWGPNYQITKSVFYHEKFGDGH